MQPDSRKDYSLEDVALLKADINPESCNYSVERATSLKLPGWEKARLYLEQLCKQIENGQLTQAKTLEPEKEVLGSDEIYLTEEDAINWNPDEDNPLKPAKAISQNKPAAASALLIIGLLTEQFYLDSERGGQTATMRNIQLLAERYGVSDKNLSEATIKRNLKAAREKLKECMQKK